VKILLFYHSLISDWNHGNAHFLRGIHTALLGMGHKTAVFEPMDNWSLSCLLEEKGNDAFADFLINFPKLKTNFYNADYAELDAHLHSADLVVVHEWNDPQLIAWVAAQKRKHHFVLLFHDTHHRAVSDPEMMNNLPLSEYDGVLAFGESLRKLYLQNGWHQNVWTWHEAADTTHYYPMENGEKVGDIVWIGNWGDDDRTAELEEFLIEPISTLGLKATFYGVRYPEKALRTLKSAGISYGGYLPTSQVSRTFSKYKATVHVPRRFYSSSLPGIPTIRPFEAMACGIPLLSAPWKDTERLFNPGEDFLLADSAASMTEMMGQVVFDPMLAKKLVSHGRKTILTKHTCWHRAEELLDIYLSIKNP
jgi:spore maturation protein CgeB